MYKKGFVDAGKLLSEGISQESVLRTISLAVGLVESNLIVSWSDGNSIEACVAILSLINIAYAEASKVVESLGNYAIDLSFCLNNDSKNHVDSVEFLPQEPTKERKSTMKQIILPNASVTPLRALCVFKESLTRYRAVLFAGSFDHLHFGHKSILTKCLLMANETLYVGLTSDTLLRQKSFSCVIQPYPIRKARIEHFIEVIRPHCKANVQLVLLETPDGIAPADSLDFDALVVTPETMAGGLLVNEVRVIKGLKKVDIFSAEILGKRSQEGKLSSTSFRKRISESLPGGELELSNLCVQWHNIILKIGVSHENGAIWWSKLTDLYGLGPWRHYHNLRHVKELLDIAFDEYESPPLGLLLSAWFHDAIYDPRSSDNENQSISLFREFVRDTALKTVNCLEIETAIDFTKDHLRALAQGDLVVSAWIEKFVEMDLAILGSNPSRYAEYRKQIRAEHQHVEESDFRRKRTNFLEKYLSFEFRYLKNSVELSASLKRNVQGEIDDLRFLKD